MPTHTSHFQQRGSVFLEALISIVIFSFGILVMTAIQARATNMAIEAKYRAEATFLANQAVGIMQADKNSRDSFAGGSSSSHEAWLKLIKKNLPNGNAVLALNPEAGDVNVVLITISWRSPSETRAHSYVMRSQIDYNA